jgi:ribosomal protein L7/L12
MDNIGIILLVTLGGVVLISIESNIKELRKDIRRINITLEKIAKQIGVPDRITDNIDIELKNLIAEGKKTEAIKKYRMVTGLGLKEAKQV